MNSSFLVTRHKVLRCWKTWDVCCALLLINRHLNLKKIEKLANCSTFRNFLFANWICNYRKWNGLQLFVLNVFETILGLDSENSSSKTISKSYLNVGAPENQRNLQTRNFRTLLETLNSHKVRLNWTMKQKFSGNTSLIETVTW